MSFWLSKRTYFILCQGDGGIFPFWVKIPHKSSFNAVLGQKHRETDNHWLNKTWLDKLWFISKLPLRARKFPIRWNMGEIFPVATLVEEKSDKKDSIVSFKTGPEWTKSELLDLNVSSSRSGWFWSQSQSGTEFFFHQTNVYTYTPPSMGPRWVDAKIEDQYSSQTKHGWSRDEWKSYRDALL